MSWIHSIWVSVALLALCGGQNTLYEGSSLSASGYHLCILNETRMVSYLVMHKVPYTVTKPCGGWLLLKTCTGTLYRMMPQTANKAVMELVTKCCDGYEQVGRYCALPVKRSGELIAKPGSCASTDGLCSRFEECEWDMDCPGWQKCCQRLNRSVCSHPASSFNYSHNGGYRLNATVTVKIDYQQLMSEEEGLLNHIRLLQAMVTGALQSDDVSVHYLSSWPVHPYRTATSLLIGRNVTLSLSNITSKLHLLLKHIQEVSSVTVEDVDECVESPFLQCSPHADCNNTEGSYQCSCHQGYIDVDPNNPGAHCTAENKSWTSTETLWTDVPPMNTTYTPATNTKQHPTGNSTFGFFNSSDVSMTTPLSNTNSAPYNSSHAPLWTSSAPSTSMSSPVDLTLSTTTCSPPSITTLTLSNVTGTSFYVHWSSQFPTNQTYWVVLSNRSEVIDSFETNQTTMDRRGLKPGVLYNVTVTPRGCGSHGVTLCVSVKTDAQTLDATTRLTNITFTDDLQNASSQAYKNLTASIMEEIYQSLSAEMKAFVNSDQLRIEIRGFSPGSVVVNFTLIFSPSQNYDISNASTALLNSLMNSSKYTVDGNNTSINDFDECAPGENDCSRWATCKNTWASYMCVCNEEFIDHNRERPGRDCRANSTSETMTPSSTPIMSTDDTTPFSLMTPSTTDPALTTVTTLPEITTVIMSTSEMVYTTDTPSTTLSATSALTTRADTVPLVITTLGPTTSITATTAPVLTTSAAAPVTTTAPTTTTIAPTTTTTAPTTTTTAPTTTIKAPTTTTMAPTTTTTDPTTTTTAPTTTITAPTTTTIAPTTTTTDPTTSTTAPTTTSTAPTTTTTTPTTTTTAPTTTITALSTTAIAPTTTTTAPTTTITAPTIMTTVPTTATIAPTTTTTAPTTTTTAPTIATTAPTTNTTAMTSVASTVNTINNPTSGAISVECRVAAITVTVAREFLLNTKIRESALYLGSLECGVNGGNATHAQLTVGWNECATRFFHNETYHTTAVTLFNRMDSHTSLNGTEETPRVQLEVPIMCTYMTSMLLSADFGSMGYDMIKDIIMGLGSFQVMVQLMSGTVPLPQNYSLSSEEAVVMEVTLNTSSEQIKVVINRCWATPTLNPADTNSYTFLENSCSLNMYTDVLMNGNSSTSRVSVKIFSFVDLDVIYLHCQVYVCVQIDPDTCVPDCWQRTSRSSKALGSAFRSVGPVNRIFADPLEQEYDMVHIIGFSCLGVGLSLLFVVAFVCLFYYQRNRIGHYNFSVKPKQENFTYLVFNT